MECLSIIVIVAIATTAVHAVPALYCPEKCTCDRVQLMTTCSNITNTTWSAFMADVPEETNSLVIHHSDFIEEMREENGELEKSSTPPVFLYNLRRLNIINSSLAHLEPDAFMMIPNVNELSFNYVNMSDMTLLLLASLSNVEVVDLSHNHMVAMPDELLQSWDSIKHLSLQHNRITEFNFVVFQKASSLESLDLSNNNISFVHPIVENLEVGNNRTSPGSLKLHSNALKYIHPTVIHNLSHPITLFLGNNPWDCHCGMQWLTDILLENDPAKVVFSDPEHMQCHTPEHLQSAQIKNLNMTKLSCREPEIIRNMEDLLGDEGNNVTVPFMNEHVLECNVTGYPQPSVYWVTPRGPVVHPDNRYWVPAEIAKAPQKIAFTGQPYFLHASIHALHNGSLQINNFRYYFEGEYTCVAVNPTGLQSHSHSVSIVVTLKENVLWSLLWGFASAFSFLLVGILYGSISYCAGRYCCKNAFVPQFPQIDYEVGYSSYDDDNYSDDSFYLYEGPPCWSPKGSPRRSPMKCVTPAEGLESTEHKNIRETLESVRARLRHNMERHVERMRSRTQNMRKNTRRHMRYMRHTTGHYMKNITHKSTHYVHKVRDGVVLGVEQVKYHVQSIKEMCGTGDIAHTISTVSVSTNVDSQQSQEVIKTFTFV